MPACVVRRFLVIGADECLKHRRWNCSINPLKDGGKISIVILVSTGQGDILAI